MWIWWIVSLIILIACIIFAYRMIVSSYEFLPSDKRYFLGFFKNTAFTETGSLQKDTLKVLKSKIQSVEDSNTFYQIQFTKFQQRLKLLEDMNTSKVSPGPVSKPKKEEEDWKELFYEENAAKEKLENELDALQQKLDGIQIGFKETETENWKEMYYAENEAKIKIENELDIAKDKLDELENRLKENAEITSRLSKIQSDYDARINHIHSLEGGITLLETNINLLQKRLAASVEREKELEQLLLSEVTVREKYSMLQKEFAQLQSDADDLRRRMGKTW